MRVFDNFIFLEFFIAESELYSFKKLFWLEIPLVCWYNSDSSEYFAIFFFIKEILFPGKSYHELPALGRISVSLVSNIWRTFYFDRVIAIF